MWSVLTVRVTKLAYSFSSQTKNSTLLRALENVSLAQVGCYCYHLCTYCNTKADTDLTTEITITNGWAIE